MSLIQWYKLDGDQTDSSGAGRHLQNISATFTTNGKIGGAYTFQYGNRIYSTSGMYFPASVSVSGWGYAIQSEQNRMLFSFNSDQTQGPDLYFTTGVICWNIGNGSTSVFKLDGVSVTQPSYNQWHHYVVVNDSQLNKALLYIDGVYQGETTYRNVTTTNKGFFIGNYYAGTSYAWQGTIDDIRIYDHQLSIKEIKELYKQKILHYKFDDFQEPTENLIYNHSITESIGNSLLWNTSYDKAQLTELEDYGYLYEVITSNQDGEGIVFTTTIDEPGVPYQITFGNVTWTSDEQHKRGLYIKYIDQSNAIINSQGGYYQYSATDSTVLSNGYCSITVTPPTNTVLMKLFIGFGGYTVAGEKVLIYRPQVEKKDHATPFTSSNRAGIINDISNYQNHSTLDISTTPQWTDDSQMGGGQYVFSTDKNRRITMPNDIGYRNELSVFAWYKYISNGVSGYNIIFGNGFFEFSVPNADGQARSGIYQGGSRYVSNHSSGLNNGEWRFIGFTCKEGVKTTYIDGVSVGTQAYTGDINYNVQGRYVGYYGATYGCNGKIDDVMVFQTALSDTEVLDLYLSKAKLDNIGNLYQYEFNQFPVSEGLIQWWTLNTDAIDYSGYNNNGTIYGATQTTGLNGGQYLFDGTDDYIKISDNITNNPSQLTISQWFMKQSGGADYECVLHKASTYQVGTSEYWLGVVNIDYLTATIGQKESGIGFDKGKTDVLCQYDVWYMLSATWDGSTVKVYVNGVYNKEYALASNPSISYPTRIGASSDTPNYMFKGKVQDVRIYDRQLTEDELLLLYNIGVGFIT